MDNIQSISNQKNIQTEPINQQVQDIINKENNQLYQWAKDWMQAHPNGTANQFQQDFSTERNIVSNQLNNAISALGSQDWHNWDTINSMNPWGAFGSYADQLNNYIWSGYPTSPIPAPSGSDPKTEIQNDLDLAEQAEEAIQSYEDLLKSLTDPTTGSIKKWQDQIAQLEAKIAALPAGDPRIAPAQADLNAAKAQLSKIENDVDTAEKALDQLNSDLSQLKILASNPNPTTDDATTADGLLTDLQSQASNVAKNCPSSDDGQAMDAAVAKVESDLASDPSKAEIQKDHDNAQQIINQMTGQMNADQSALDTLNQQIANLQKTIDALKAGPQGSDPTKTAADLSTAQKALDQLQGDADAMSKDINSLNAQLNDANTKMSDINALLLNPTPSGAAQADQDLSAIQTDQNLSTTTQNQFSSTSAKAVSGGTDYQAVTNAIATVQQDVQPTPPPSSSGLSSYIDFKSASGANGNQGPTVQEIDEMIQNMGSSSTIYLAFDTFGNLSSDKDLGAPWMKELISAAHAAGKTVVMSVGGELWDPSMDLSNMTPDQAKQLADTDAEALKSYGIDGLDFDAEAYAAENREVPQLTAFFSEMKATHPNLKLSFTIDGPLNPTVWGQQFPFLSLTTLKDASGNYIFDRINLMTYPNAQGFNETNLQQWVQACGADRLAVGFTDTDGSIASAEANFDLAKKLGINNAIFWPDQSDHDSNSHLPNFGNNVFYQTLLKYIDSQQSEANVNPQHTSVSSEPYLLRA